MNECPMKGYGLAQNPEVHNWRVRDDGGGWPEAYCTVEDCKAWAGINVVNDWIDSKEEEIEALSWMLSEHVAMLGDVEKWAAAWEAAAKNRYGRQQDHIAILERRIEQMCDYSSCVHCGELIAEDDPERLDHWKECSEHPANKRIKELETELQSGLATMTAIKWLQELLNLDDNTCGKALTRVAELDEENTKLSKMIVRQGELLHECYLLLERYEEGYLGPIALLRQRIISNG